LNPDSSVPESPAQESAKPKRSRRPPAGNRKAKPSAEPSESAGAENAKIKLPAWILPEETKSRKPRKKKAAPAEPEIAEEQPSEAAKPGRSRRPAAEKPKAEPSAEPAEPAKIPVAKFKLPAWILPEESPMEEPDPEITEPEAAKPEASKPETTKPETTKLEISEEQAPEPPKPKRRRRPAGGRKKKASMPTEPVDDTAAPEPVPKPDTWSADTFQVLPEEGKVRFHDMNLPEPLMHGIFDLHFTFCTPIQAEIMPSTLAGRDAFGKAQTGTGKTAAFLITVITRMLNNPIPGQRKPGTPRVLILAPTRELVIQISEEARQLAKYCGLSVIAVFGGMDYDKQRRQLTGKPVDIMVATPGRLLDFQQRRDLYLNKVETLIIDEADRMLDMGFIPDVRKIIYSTPAKDSRQTLLFSATLTETITRLAESWTRDPVTVEIEPEKIAVDTVDQVVYIVTAKEKFALLYNVIEQQKLERVLIFCNRKDQVVKLSEMLTRFGITCSMLSGDVPQQKRVQRLEAFKAGKIRVIVATDVVARGIHIEGMDHVINFKLPHDPEDYVHRIGRTGRAGAAGTSISFADDDDAFYLPDIEAFLGKKLPCIRPDDAWLVMPKPLYPYKPDSDRPPRKPGGSRSGGGKPGNPSPGRRRPGRS
jgi:ATP-dependent RNA helicase RhlB